MFTWKDYYVEHERRLDRMNEAKKYRLLKAFFIKSIWFNAFRPGAFIS